MGLMDGERGKSAQLSQELQKRWIKGKGWSEKKQKAKKMGQTHQNSPFNKAAAELPSDHRPKLV